jgi:DNA ligase-1
MTLLKVKSFHDAEARVLGHQPGAGRHKGRLGALFVEMADGTRFAVGTGFSDAQRGNPPPVGSLITFRYQELSEAGVPRFPSYVGLRRDEPVPAPAAATPAKKKAPAQKVVAVVPPAPPAPAPAPAAQAAGKRYFEFAQGTSSKFWEVWVSGHEMTTRWGRIGSPGQSKTKAFADADKASVAAAKLIEEKTADGYVEKEAS